MTDNSLVAPVQSSREAWTGASLADSIEGLVDAIKSEGWVDDALAGAALGVEVAATVMDPISALLANGLGWAIEYFEPLREVLDDLTGKPDVVRSHAATWNNMATELHSMSADLKADLQNDLSGWKGDAADAYQRLMANNVDAIGGLAAVSAAMAAATEGAGGLVELTREIVRDLIADLVARVIVWAVEAIFVVTIPVIASQIAAAVVKWAGRILVYTTALITSLTDLNKLLGG
ncbi:WXG100 family type VII secretion target [Kibdelosporangium aridum]|uniref:WXG100 family type VII secretion target n=1 Tax=Kibdelosporangium aridum TaxID=2030 RepID=UPI00052446EB